MWFPVFVWWIHANSSIFFRLNHHFPRRTPEKSHHFPWNQPCLPWKIHGKSAMFPVRPGGDGSALRLRSHGFVCGTHEGLVAWCRSAAVLLSWLAMAHDCFFGLALWLVYDQDYWKYLYSCRTINYWDDNRYGLRFIGFSIGSLGLFLGLLDIFYIRTVIGIVDMVYQVQIHLLLD